MLAIKTFLGKLPIFGKFLKVEPVPVTPTEVDPTHVHFHGIDLNGPADQPIQCVTLDSSKSFGVIIAVPRGNVLGEELMRVVGLNKHNFDDNLIILDLREGIKFAQEEK